VSEVTSLRFRIGAGMTLLIGLAMVVALAAVRENRRLVRAMTEEIDALQEGTHVSNGLVRSVMNEIRAAQEYLVAPSNQARQEFLLHGDSAYFYQSRFQRLRGLPTSDRLIVNRIANRQASIEVAFALAHALSDTRRPAEALAKAADAKAPTDSLLAELQALSAARNRSAVERSAALRAAVGQRQVVLGIGIFLVVVLGIGITLRTVHWVNDDIRRLVGAAGRFGAGDLRPMTLGRMPREIQPLAEAMDDMSRRLRELVTSVTTEATQISTSAGDFSAMSEELAASSGEISTAMVKVASSADTQVRGMEVADDMLAGIRESTVQNAELAERLDTLGQHMHGLAARHHADVSAATQTLLDVREFVQASATQVQELTRLSGSITEFIDLIKQISSQTNLLALNAAIEAARAGEHGRGFAVVADEVRNLADSSARAAADVASTVQFIVTQVREVGNTMRVGTDKVRGIEQVAAGAAGALDDIVTSVQDIRDAATRVNKSADYNRTVVDELSKRAAEVAAAASQHASASEEVSAAAEQQSASTEEMAAAASDLLQGAQRLAALVEQFKT